MTRGKTKPITPKYMLEYAKNIKAENLIKQVKDAKAAVIYLLPFLVVTASALTAYTALELGLVLKEAAILFAILFSATFLVYICVLVKFFALKKELKNNTKWEV